jgi:hypothetical protein
MICSYLSNSISQGSSWGSSSYAEASTSKNNDYAMGTGARPKDSSYTLSDPRIFNGVKFSTAHGTNLCC